ncbi:hypothetical protein Ahia01_000536600 [Argonauta hians]
MSPFLTAVILVLAVASGNWGQTEAKPPKANTTTNTNTTIINIIPGRFNRSCHGHEGEKLASGKSDCAAYWTCVSGFLRRQRCPRGTLFNDVTKLCDFPSAVSCNRVRHPAQPNVAASSAYSLGACSTASEGLRVADPTDCASFRVCMSGQIQQKKCGPGTLYNDITQLCDFVSAVSCGKRPQGGGGGGAATTTTPAPPVIPTTTLSPAKQKDLEYYEFWYNLYCQTFGGAAIVRWPHPLTCTSFYECNNKVLTERSCPSHPGTLYFNKDFQNCVTSNRATCAASLPYGQNFVPSPEEQNYRQICTSSPSSEMQWLNTRDCRRYFKCHYGVFSQVMCPFTTQQMVYNSISQRCEVSNNVCVLYWRP